MKIGAVVVAAGSGRRFGSKKQFAVLNDKPVIGYSIEILREFCDDIVVVVHTDDMEFVKKMFGFVNVVEGGKERMYSVYNGLNTLSCDIVLVHDAARPLIDKDLVESVIQTAEQYNSAVPVINISETVKQIKNGLIEDTIDRDRLCLSQTPQAFVCDMLKKAYKKAIKSKENYTDESSIWEKFYGSVKAVEGDRKNIKITTKYDLEIARCLLG